MRNEDWRSQHRNDPDYKSAHLQPFTPPYFHAFEARKMAIPDPTALIIVDEADRLSMPRLELFRSIFDESGLGLIGMRGLEKRTARYLQLLFCIGFIHELRALVADEVKYLLEESKASSHTVFFKD